MCGIIAVVQRPARRAAPDLAPLLESLAGARHALHASADILDGTGQAATALEHVDQALRGVPGVRALLRDPDAAGRIHARLVNELHGHGFTLVGRAVQVQDLLQLLVVVIPAALQGGGVVGGAVGAGIVPAGDE